MSLVSTIPTEILTKIFLLLRDGPIILQELSNASYFDRFPWAVGQVCRHWRSAFLSYPALWTCLSLEGYYCSQLSVTRVAEINRRTWIYLDRSEQQPLTITVRVANPSFSPIWSILLSCSDRWKKADLQAPTDIIANGLAERRAKMPILESLKIAVLLGGQEDPTAFEVTPHLTELDLVYHGPRKETRNWMLRGWSFPWAQLTKLGIKVPFPGFAEMDAFHTFLLQIRNVEELRIVVSSFIVDAYESFDPPSVHFGRLRLLETSVIYPSVFPWFEAPLLERLVVEGGHDSVTENVEGYSEELLSFVRRSSCRIHHLTLRDCNVVVALEVMEALASVRELCIKKTYNRAPGEFRSLVREIAESYDDGRLPNLRVVQVPCCPELFEQLISGAHPFFEAWSRGPNMAPLKKLVVSVDWDDCSCGLCPIIEPTAIARAFDVMCNWPSFSVVHLNYDRQHLILSLDALVGSTEVDLTIYYPTYMYSPEESYEHYRLLQNEGQAVNN